MRIAHLVRAAWHWGGSKWVLLVAAVLSTAGWVLEVRPLAPVWGPVGTWVGGLATAAGLAFTGIQLRDNRTQREEELAQRKADEAERREAMARSVSINSVVKEKEDEGWFVEYTIANGGDFPIENVLLTMVDLDADDIRPEDQVGTCLQLVIGTMHHKQVLSDEYGPLRLGGPPAFGEITALGSVHFSDTWGQSWWRGTGELKKTAHPAYVC